MRSPLPIDYTGVALARDGHESSIDLGNDDGWMSREDVREAIVFTLQPKPGSQFPTPVSVHLFPLPDGTKKELIYFSRVHGRVVMSANEGDEGVQTDLFRLYCVGWKAVVAGIEIEHRVWLYPGGGIVVAQEPPYIDDLIMHYATKDLPHPGPAASAESVLVPSPDAPQ